MVDGYFDGPAGRPGAEASSLRRGNFMARMRMAVLYDRSVTWRGLVVGTGNKTESLIGYTTLFGDNACAFNPIGDLYKSQVRQVVGGDRRPRGDHPQGAVGRPVARPDRRDRGGLPYPVLDRLLFWRVDKRRSVEEVVALGFDRGARRAGRPDGRRRPSSSARCRRSRSSGRGRPASTTSTRAAGPARRAAEPVARRGGTLYVVATPIGNLGDVTLRAIEVLRAVPLIAAEDTRLTRRLLSRYEIADADDQLPRPERPAPAERAARAPPRRRGPRARDRRRDAGRERPGRRARRAWAAEGGDGRPDPGASAVLAALVASGVAGPRWSFEGFLPRTGRDRRERIARIAADERATRRLRGAGPRRGDAARPGRGVRRRSDPAAVCRELTKLHEEIVRGSLGELAAAGRATGS